MVKAYLRYEFGGAFGVISSGPAPCYDSTGKLLITAALENLAVWNVKQGSLVGRTRCSVLLALPVQWKAAYCSGYCIAAGRGAESPILFSVGKAPMHALAGGHPGARPQRQRRHIHQQLPCSRRGGVMHHARPWHKPAGGSRLLGRLGAYTDSKFTHAYK